MQKFLETYKKLNAENLETLQEIYTSDIHFIDPAHDIHGLDQLTDYFARLYKNITTIEFKFSEEISSNTKGYVQWQMRFRHPRIKGGQEIAVPGASYLKFTPEKKVSFHQDYFDLGAMIYQHLPLIGKMITMINRRLGS